MRPPASSRGPGPRDRGGPRTEGPGDPRTDDPAPSGTLHGRAARVGLRVRWTVAAIATVIVVSGLGALFSLAPGPGVAPLPGPGGGRTAALAYVPADAFAYLELEVQPSAAEREQLAALFSRFPGFADRAAFELKLDGLLDRALLTASGQRHSYSDDVKSWFGGQLGVAVLALPETPSVAAPPAVGLLQVSDDPAAAARAEQSAAEARDAGASVTHETLTVCTATGAGDQARVWSVDDPAGAAGPGDVAFGLRPGMLVVAADAATVAVALEVRAGCRPGLLADGAVRDAFGRLEADRIGAMYVDARTLVSALRGVPELAAVGSTMPLLTAIGSPDRIVGALHAEADRLVLEARPVAAGPAPEAGSGGDARRMAPAGVLGWLEVGDAAAVVREAVLAARRSSDPEATRQLQQLEGALGAPLETYFEWVAAAGVAVIARDQDFTAGLVATVSDRDLARRRMDRLIGLLRLGAAVGSLDVEVTDERLEDVTITTVRTDPTPEAAASTAVSFALREGILVVAPDAALVRELLRVAPEASLAADGRFARAVAADAAAAGESPHGLLFVDLAALRARLEERSDANVRQPYEMDIRPYVLPFDHLLASVTTDDAGPVLRLTVAVTP